MVAHAGVAASSSNKLHYIFVLICYLFAFFYYWSMYYIWQKYTHQCLKKKGRDWIKSSGLEIITAHNILWPPSWTSRTKCYQKRWDRPRKRARRAKLTQFGPKPIPLPSLLLANVWSQENKMDEIILTYAHILTETWIHHNIPISLDGRTVLRVLHKTLVRWGEVGSVFTSMMLGAQM